MKKLVLLLLFVLPFQIGFSQVGINTTTPNAQLDIRSSNQAAPSNTDGILIPKIDAFPVTNPTATQTGMMVYLTTTSAGKSPGFYYWNNATVSWLPVSKTDDDWYKITTTSAPDAISDDMYHTGNVAIGRNTALAKLDVEQTASSPYLSRFKHSNPPNASTSIVTINEIASSQASGVVVGLSNSITSNNSVIGYGVYNYLMGNTDDTQVGVFSTFNHLGSNLRIGSQNFFPNGTGDRYGLHNYFAGIGNEQRGVYNQFIGNPNQESSGLYNHFNEVNTFAKKGVYNNFINNSTTSGDNYGLHNNFDGIGSSSKIGVRNSFSGNGDGTFYGNYNTASSYGIGSLYASHSILDGTGSGDKIGTSVIIYPSAGGNHYGIYSNVTKPTGYSGYFLGRFAIGTSNANTYIMPSFRGTANQIMQTDGVGNVTWQNPNTALNNFAWTTTGNSGTNDATNFIGTTDNQDLVLKAQSQLRMQLFTVPDALNFIGNVTGGDMRINLLTFGRGAGNSPANLACGMDALRSNTTGDFNAAIGPYTLRSNSTGSFNTAVGNNALLNNQTGSNNTAVGYKALSSCITGVFNNAFGYNSLQKTTGSWNTGFGSETLRDNTTGTSNTAIGHNSLPVNTTGSYNLAVGNLAMENNISGGFNVAVGGGALNELTTGLTNTALGYLSLRYNVTGSGNVAIGHQAGYNELGSNKLYIENSVSATPLIYGEFDTDILRSNSQRFFVNDPTVNGVQMMIKNSDKYTHGVDANLDFGIGNGYFMMATAEGQGESGGIRGDGDNVSIWSPGDGGRQLRILDEDAWSDNNGNPYDNAAEVAYIANNGQYFQVSDRNKKENIQKIKNATTKIAQISGYTYQFKLKPAEIEKGEKPTVSSGVLAQEIETVLPEAVQKNESGEYFVDYAAITPLLIEAIKEQNTKIQSLEERLKALEEKVSK